MIIVEFNFFTSDVDKIKFIRCVFEMNESSKKNVAPRIEVLIVEIDRYLSEEICHIDDIEGYINSLFYKHKLST